MRRCAASSGHFYYRPPNGESGADVAGRVRAALDAVARDHAGERVLVVCHQITILCARYVLDRLSEEELSALWKRYDLANCSVTDVRARRARSAGAGALQLHAARERVAADDRAGARDGAGVTRHGPA